MRVRAIYEHGVFRPLDPVTGLRDQEPVEFIIVRGPGLLIPPSVPPAAGRRIVTLLAGTLTQAEAEEMQRAIDEEFERVPD